MTTVPGVTVLQIGFRADPEKADPDWIDYAKQGYAPDKWAREMEMDAHAGASSAVFGKEYPNPRREQALTPDFDRLVIDAFDFGKGFPARVWMQMTATGQKRILASRCLPSTKLRPFLEQTLAWELEIFGGTFLRRVCYCDPAGNQDKDDGLKSVEVLREYGFLPKWRGSTVESGIETMIGLLREAPNGEPSLVIDPRYNGELVTAFKSGYARNAQGEPTRVHPYIDLMDATRYGLINTTPRRGVPRVHRPTFHINDVSGYGRAPMPSRSGYVA